MVVIGVKRAWPNHAPVPAEVLDAWLCDWRFRNNAHATMVAFFPHKIKAGSAGWTRAVALFD